MAAHYANFDSDSDFDGFHSVRASSSSDSDSVDSDSDSGDTSGDTSGDAPDFDPDSFTAVNPINSMRPLDGAFMRSPPRARSYGSGSPTAIVSHGVAQFPAIATAASTSTATAAPAIRAIRAKSNESEPKRPFLATRVDRSIFFIIVFLAGLFFLVRNFKSGT